jgi:putative DNA primase/helicase
MMTCFSKVAASNTSSGFIAREGFTQYNQSVATLYAPHDGFNEAMLDAGLVSGVVVIPDGQIHRFKADGDKNKASWYVFYGDGGAFGNWRTSLRETWFRGDLNEGRKREIYKEIIATQKAAREKSANQHRQVARTARRRLDAAIPAKTHPYLTAKNVRSYGLRIEGNKLLIPLWHERRLWSLQTIAVEDDGFKKRFLWHGRKAGCYFPIGIPGERIWLAEGYSTAATVHEVTGDCVVCAFDAHNLVKVAKHVRAQFIDHEIYVAADNDEAGIKAATDAMQQHNLEGWVAPDDWRTDWNDHCTKYGAEITLRKLNGEQWDCHS